MLIFCHITDSQLLPPSLFLLPFRINPPHLLVGPNLSLLYKDYFVFHDNYFVLHEGNSMFSEVRFVFHEDSFVLQVIHYIVMLY